MVNKYVRGIAFVLLMMGIAVLVAMAAAPDITITINSPTPNGSTITGNFSFSVTVNDSIENITNVEFFYKNDSIPWTSFYNYPGLPLLNGTPHTLSASLDTTSLANGSDYQFNVTVVDNSTSNNVKSDIIFFTISNVPADTTPPLSITDLHNTTYALTYINWTWIDPADSDFSKVMIYINGAWQSNVTKGLQLYSATGLSPDTEYNISTQTVDASGNINSTWVNHSARTSIPDTTPPESITDLHNTTYAPTYINWTWIDPADSDFSKVMIYISGAWQSNVTKGLQLYSATGLTPDTEYNISTQTVDASGNINSTWVNHSARTKYPPPSITHSEPVDATLERTQGQSLLFLVNANQNVTVRWYKNGSEIDTAAKTVNAGEEANFTFTGSPGTYIITANASNANGSDTRTWTFIIRSKTFQTGNRIWDATQGMGSTYTWNPYSFSGFYYNLDSDLGTENLQITNIGGRSLGKGAITYTTSPQPVSFTYSKFGSYQVIGFMAEKYFAGYTSDTLPPNPTSAVQTVSTLSAGQLHKVLFDDKDKRTISEGGTFTLKEGYVLQVKAVDIGAGPGQIWYVLLKDGSEVDQGTLAGDQTYVYQASRVGEVTDLPIIFVHFTNVFRGREINAAFVEGVFQISDSPTNVKSGDRKGVMKVTSVDATQIKMINEDTIDLSSGVTRDLMGNLKIMVADNSSVLRFGLTTEISGNYEVRGTIYNATDEWTPMNFGFNTGGTNIGFYYDIDGDVGSEKLRIIEDLSGKRQISEDGLEYSTSPEPVGFEYSKFGLYQVIGFKAEKYFAGYTNSGPTDATSSVEQVSTLSSGQLHKVLLDDKDKRTISEGGTITLKEGYVLQIKAVDIGAGPGQIWYVLLKDGNEIDQGTLTGGQTYVYKPGKVGSINDLPILFVHFTSVFRGREINAAFIEGVFQISDSPTYVNNGDRVGAMEVTSVNETQIIMRNKNTISLTSASTSDVMGNIRFKVADSSTLRFYPFVKVTEDMIANQLVIDAPAKASAGDIINIKVTAGGNIAGNVSITIDSTDAGQTDNNGYLNYTLPKTLKGNYNITANKLGYQKAVRGIEILQYVEYRLSMEVPAKANQFETMRIRITYNGSAISGATLTYDNATIGTTDSNGTLNYKPETSGTHTISASKTGYITVTREIEVRAPYTEYKALDINVTPEVIFSGQKYLVRSNVTNVGTKADTLPVILMVNGSIESSTNVTIDPGKTQEVNFTQKMTLPMGNYSIEILDQKKVVEVKEEPLSYLMIGGIMTGLGAVIIYFLTAKNKISLDAIRSGLNVETMRSKLNVEAFKKLLERSGKRGI